MIQDSWVYGNEFDDPEEDVRIPNPNATKQLFTITVEAEDVYDEGPWNISQIISAIESCESGLKVLDVAELPSEAKSNIEERPARKPRT